jgi:hypothetical protein
MAGRLASVGDRVVREALRQGARRGMGDGSRTWIVIGAAALTVRLLQRMATSKPTVITERLAPGESLVIRHLAPGE